MSYTIHYIDANWNLQSVSLGTQYLPEDHTSPVLAEAMESTLQQWQLKAAQQVSLTTDNGANIVSAARSLKWVRVSCFGHNLHLAITKAIANDGRCARAIAVGRKIVSAFSLSWKKHKALTKAQADLNLPCHSLISDCKTRWGSTQKMLERLLEQEAAIRLVLSTDRKTSHLVPSWQDVAIWTALNEALSPLAAFTDVMSGEVLPLIILLILLSHL